MKRGLWFAAIAAAAVLSAVLARPGSRGAALGRAAIAYSVALEEGSASEALDMMTPETAEGLCENFVLELAGVEAPDRFVFDGTDSRGIRMAGETRESGSRVIWFSPGELPLVVHDTALNNILGNAVLLCRANAVEYPGGNCPVSGAPYDYDPAAGIVVCPEGHLGEGLVLNANGCSARRDSVAQEIEAFVAAGYEWPFSLEEIYTISSGEFGRRGGYRCPDNGYKYYEIRDRAVYCPFHEETTPVTAEE